MSVTSATRTAQRRRRMFTYLWIAGLAALTISLIYWELTAILYILATVGVTVLLLVVATTDLKHSEAMVSDSAPLDRAGVKSSASRRT
ncbi:MAG: hypothetical protein JWM21_48 [Acidobacteria bacterium]|nr:hypothetical protein [Acidobacteriota bacterium]